MSPITAIRKILHKLLHWIGINKGNVESYTLGGIIHVGFRCDCGKLLDNFPCGYDDL